MMQLWTQAVRGLSSMINKSIVVSGPPGSGKTTIIKQVLSKQPNTFAFSVSHTTRHPRVGEVDGVDYWFISKDQMKKMIRNNQFIEYTGYVDDHMYGTSKKIVENIQKTGRICLFDIELHGVRTLKTLTDFPAKYIWITAPNMEILEQRLIDRNTETNQSLRNKLKQAQNDIDDVAKHPDLFDYHIINDDKDRAVRQFLDAVEDEIARFNRSFLVDIQHAPALSAPFSQAVRVGDTLYISGTVGKDPATGVVIEGTIEDETRQTLKNIGNVLAAVNSSFANVVKMTVLLTDINDWPKMNAVFKEFFPENVYPARTAYQVSALASGAHIEIDAIAEIGNVSVNRHVS